VSNLITIAQTLANRVRGTELSNTTTVDNKTETKLNYEVMYKMLESEVEKHILENQGNRCVDDFRQNILTKFQSLVNILTK
jgi:HPt (histidine-containing phosphotransfer) domain-containing protein